MGPSTCCHVTVVRARAIATPAAGGMTTDLTHN